LYFHNEKINQTNGDGEIQWTRTIENFDPFFVNNRPLYLNISTTKTIDNQLNFFVRLHKYILTRASRELVADV